MSSQFTILLVIQIVASFSLIVLVLLQQGKGADIGSAFGGGSAGSLFGASGAANFLSRATKWAAIVFFLATMGLAYVGTMNTVRDDTGIMEGFTSSQSVPSTSDAKESSVPSVPSDSSVPSVPAAKE